MTYGYIRVSTDKQTSENQRFEIRKFAEANDLRIEYWIDETVSGTKDYADRKLGGLLNAMREDDLIICTELSRLGRSLYMIMDILSTCMDKGCKVWTVKDGFRLGDDIQSKVLAFAFGLAAEIERDLISQRTRESLARMKAEGRKLGRPIGALGKHTKLSGKEEVIKCLLDCGNTWSAIARSLKVDRSTLVRFCEARGIKPSIKCTEIFEQ